MRLYNSLTQQKEVFRPLDKEHVRMYVCGPTVYDHIHVGNARPIVVFDVLFRLLCRLYPRVTYVRNITDVDDKIMQRAKERNLSPEELTQETTQLFFQDIQALRVLTPTHQPRATAYIASMIQMIQKLLDKGHAYIADHHVLFDIRTDPAYGSLSRCDAQERQDGARIEIALYKKDPGDFILWKPSSEDQMGWESPWGYGRPGWHIECSAMSADLLGPSFDLHGGGQDLKFPHHENEMAQSRCAHHGMSMAQTWLHNGLITMTGQKMSKSLGHFVMLHEALRFHAGEVIRYFFLNTHYRHTLDWSDDLLDAARASVNRLYLALRPYASVLTEDAEISYEKDSDFLDALQDDLNTPYALHLLHQWASLLNREKKALDHQMALARKLWRCGRFIGLFGQTVQGWFQHKACSEHDDGAHDIERLVQERDDARMRRDFKAADAVRDILKRRGILLEDREGRTEWRFDPVHNVSDDHT